MSMKDMCEKIVEADFLRKPDGNAPTAKEIFNYSPTGELYKVFLWYELAVVWLKIRAMRPDLPVKEPKLLL